MIPVFFCPFRILFFLPRLRTKRPYNIDFRLCLRFKKSSIVVSNPYFNSSLCLKSINQHTRDVVLSCSFVLPDIIIIPFMYFFQMSTLSWNISDVKELNTSDVGKCASKRWQCSTTQLHVNVAYSMQISDNQHASKWTIQIFKSPGKNVK